MSMCQLKMMVKHSSLLFGLRKIITANNNKTAKMNHEEKLKG